MAAIVLQISSHILSDNALPSNRLPKHGKPNILSNPNSGLTRFRVRAVQEKHEEIKTPSSPEEITKKYGLEAGLWKILSVKEDGNEENKERNSKGNQAKELLAKYGGAYLATSITLSLVSFGLCYALISAGGDISALLQKVGISTSETGEKLGTFALAYAAHKAASPIRFPPTNRQKDQETNLLKKKKWEDNKGIGKLFVIILCPEDEL